MNGTTISQPVMLYAALTLSQGRLIGATATFAVLLVGAVLSLLGAFGVHF